MHPLLLLSLLCSTSPTPPPSSCLDERSGRRIALEAPHANRGRVDVWWDLHCPVCHVLIERLARDPGLSVVAHRLGTETGDRAHALRALPPGATACRALRQPPSAGLPYAEWRSPRGDLLAAWNGGAIPGSLRADVP
jgi:hypothetical protein